MTTHTIKGNAGKDAANFNGIVRFSVAVNGDNGVTWYSVSAFEEMHAKAMRVKKGDFIKVTGLFKQNTDKEGKTWNNITARDIEHMGSGDTLPPRAAVAADDGDVPF